MACCVGGVHDQRPAGSQEPKMLAHGGLQQPLTWHDPLTDGGLRIDAYEVQHRMCGLDEWATISTSRCHIVIMY